MRRSLWSLLAATAVLVVLPSAARAQSSNPLASCKYSVVEREQFTYPLVPGTDNVHEGILSGAVKVICDDLTLQAEEIRWREDSDMVYAKGDVFFQQKGTQISAEKAEMDRRTHLGTFYNASGWLEILSQKPDKTLFGTQEPYAMFQAEKLEKIGPRLYQLTKGSFTTCRQPTPRWEMTASTVILATGEHAFLKNMVLHVKDVPIFYLPALYYPINHEDRATGFLLPNYGNSSYRGLTLSNAFFWAINRSRDVTFYHDLFSKTGQGLGSEYRYVGDDGSSGNGRIYMIDEHEQLNTDGTVASPAHKSYDLRGNINQALGQVWRLTGHINYFTDITTQSLYNQNIADLTRRQRSYGASVTGGTGRYRVSATYEQQDIFSGTSASRVGTAPFGTFSMAEKPIGQSKIYFSANANGGFLVRQDNIDDPKTDRSLFRFDMSPRVSVPISNLSALTVTASAAFRYTYWLDSQDPVTLARIKQPIGRDILDLQSKVVGPVFSRIWHTPKNGYADGFKHLIEPNFTLAWLSPFKDSARIVQLDGTDTLVTGTTTMTYGITNRILAKRRMGAPIDEPVGAGGVREIVTVDITQTYYTNSLAAQYDPNYQSSYAGLYTYQTPASPFSPVQVTANVRPTDTTTAQFRMEYDTKYNAVRTYNASGTVNEPAAQITAGWSKRQYIPGLTGFNDPNGADHFLNLHATLRQPSNHFGGTYAFNYDVLRGYFLQRRYQFFYNSQCCGLAFDLQTVDLTHFSGLTFAGSDRRMSISFTLAGIGTFSNPLGSFGGATR
jgi:lipopolysaccharide assembly outer membrane protein LptD (OstA)